MQRSLGGIPVRAGKSTRLGDGPGRQACDAETCGWLHRSTQLRDRTTVRCVSIRGCSVCWSDHLFGATRARQQGIIAERHVASCVVVGVARTACVHSLRIAAG